MRLAPVVSAAAALAAALLLPARASAYEGQWHAGADLGYLGGWRGLGSGFGGGLEVGYDAKDWVGVFVAANATHHPWSKSTIPTGVLGVTLRFDVLRVVPYVGLHAGFATVLTPKVDPLAYLDVGVPFGLDYYISRSLTVSAAGRFQILGGHGTAIPMMGVTARVAYVWGG